MSFFIWSHIFKEWNNHALFIWSHILSPNVHHVVLLTGKVQSLETSSNVSCECTDKGLSQGYGFLLKERFLNTSFYWDWFHILEMHLPWCITDCTQDLVKLTACNWTRAPSLYYIFCCLFGHVLYLSNIILHAPDDWLVKPHNSHSSVSQPVSSHPINYFW